MTQVSEIRISYKNKISLKNAPKISSAECAAKVIFDTWDKDSLELYEEFKVILLNNSHNVKGILTISKGGITGTLVDIRILFAAVLKSLSTAIIITHNHPSGNKNPSEADKKLTMKIKNGAELFDIKVLDHIIITPNDEYYSFSNEGLL